MDNVVPASQAQGTCSGDKNKQQQKCKHLLLQRVTSETEVSHSSASWPSPAPPLFYHPISLSCTVGPVKCLQGGYHGSGCHSCELVRSGSASDSLPLDAVASGACAAVNNDAALGLPNGLRKRKIDDIVESDSGIRIQSRGRKASCIQATIDVSDSAVCKKTASCPVKDTSLKEGNCHDSQLKAEKGRSGILPHSKDACSVLPTEAFEAILDILQKKDKYGVFSEPVDATEVPGYYDIIKEPMDFGTIRYKLSKGEYVSLDLFKVDASSYFFNAIF